MTDEGYIKFDCDYVPGPPPERQHVEDLLQIRDKLFRLRLIGLDKEGVPYGNISKRVPESNQFYVTGTGTGSLDALCPEHLSLVLIADLQRNVLRCSGPVKASSESLTHAALYKLDQGIAAVVHVHHGVLWQHLMDAGVPTTHHSVRYGTPQMAEEVQRLYVQGGARKSRILAMGGHESGVLSFGTSLDEAYSVLMSWHRRVGDQ
jgi:L-ribulose-5-phosphate 4-epimerase